MTSALVTPLVVVALSIVTGAARADSIRVGDRAPELDVAVDAAGKPFRLATYRGRWVVLAVGAAWCIPCKAELPVWDRLAGKLAGRATFIALDVDDDVDDGRQLHADLKLRSMTRAYLPQERSAVAERYGALTLPMTFVVDPAGVVRYAHAGFDSLMPKTEEARLAGALDGLLPKPKPKPTQPKPAPDPPSPPAIATIPRVRLLAPPTSWNAAAWGLTW